MGMDVMAAAALLPELAARGLRPAALLGDWFGGAGLLARDTDLRAMPDGELFPDAPGAGWFLGWRPYAGAAVGGYVADVELLDDASRPGAGSPGRAAGPSAGSAVADPDIAWDRGDEASHRAGVESCLEAIRRGDVYQACLSTRFAGTFDGDVVEVAARWFAARVQRFRPARAAFLVGRDTDGGDVVVASLSPEEFLVRDGDVVRETPIKGTVPLDRDPAELLASRKDVAENIMIVDLVRHDLGQVACTGGVTVPDLLSVSRAPGVWHLHSTVRADLPAGLPNRELVEACFPPASVTGTPKKRAAELIDEWEPVDRGVHCGAIGASNGHRMELNVAIRTAEFRATPAGPGGPGEADGTPGAAGAVGAVGTPAADAPSGSPDGTPDSTSRGVVEAGVGGGITIDSTPDGEWAEVLAKAAPLIRPV
ncbi:chorismate-binding protein [Corynebacterium sp. 335C]